MCGAQAGTKLPRNFQRLIGSQLAFARQPFRKRLTIKKLHGEKVHFPIFCLRSVNLVHKTDIRMPDLERAFEFRREQPAKTSLTTFNGDALIALAVKGLIHHAHAAFANLTHDHKAFGDNLSWLEGFRLGLKVNAIDEWPAKEVTHALFPFHDLVDFAIECSFVFAGDPEELVALSCRHAQRRGGEGHYALVVFCAALHGVLPTRSNSHFLPSCHSRSTVRWLSCSFSAASCGLSPRYDINTTTVQRRGASFSSSSSNSSTATATSSRVRPAIRPSGTPSRATSSALGRLRA